MAPLPRQVSLMGKLAQIEDKPTAAYLRELQLELNEVEFHVETNFDYMQAVRYIRRYNGIVVIPSILDNFPLTVVECITNGFCFIASDAGGIPEMVDQSVCFPATVEGLRRKLEELPQIDFARLAHPYDPRLARATWLAHVEAAVAEARASRQAEPPARVLREEMPPISICVPYYRHDCYLSRMVSGFLGMDLPQLQLVVVDDGTPPGERACFDMLRRELEPLGHVFHRQQNAGPGAARNRAVTLARYDLLLFFDADNCPFPDIVERLWSAMAHSGADMVCAPYVAVPPMMRRPVLEDALFQYLAPGGPVILGVLENVVGDVCSLVRRPAFEALDGFSEVRQAWEDWEFFLRAVAKGFRHYIYPEPLFYYTYDPEGRNARASEYENRLNLFGCFSQMPSQILCEALRTFAAEHLALRR
jgi:GT2 family glycosyltransferase